MVINPLRPFWPNSLILTAVPRVAISHPSQPPSDERAETLIYLIRWKPDYIHLLPRLGGLPIQHQLLLGSGLVRLCKLRLGLCKWLRVLPCGFPLSLMCSIFRKPFSSPCDSIPISRAIVTWDRVLVYSTLVLFAYI